MTETWMRYRASPDLPAWLAFWYLTACARTPTAPPVPAARPADAARVPDAALAADGASDANFSPASGYVTMRDLSAEPVATFIADSRSGHHPGELDHRWEYMPRWTPAERSDAELRRTFQYVDGL